MTRVVLGASSAGEAGDDVHMGADAWFVDKFRMGGVGEDCATTLGGSGDGSLAVGRVNEACEGADGVIESAIGVADPDVDFPRRKRFLRGFFIMVVSVELDVYSRLNWGEAGGGKEERLRTQCCVLKFSHSQTLVRPYIATSSTVAPRPSQTSYQVGISVVAESCYLVYTTNIAMLWLLSSLLLNIIRFAIVAHR